MAERLIQESTLVSIADAIRSKTGIEDLIAVTDMAAQIESIAGGGGGVVLPKFEFSDGYFDVGTDKSARTINHGMRKMPDLIIVYAQCLTGNGMANLEIPSTTSFLMAWGVKSTFQCDTRSGCLFNTWGHDNALGLDNLTAGEIGDGYVYCQDNSTFVVDGGGHLIPNARYLWFAFSGISAAGVQTAGDHTITFKSEDGSTVLGEKPVMHGDTCGDPVALGLFEEPTKEGGTDTVWPEHVGWAAEPNSALEESALTNITEDKTVFASFETFSGFSPRTVTGTLYNSAGGYYWKVIYNNAAPSTITVGKEYLVEVDGVAYTRTCFNASTTNQKLYNCLGNASLYKAPLFGDAITWPSSANTGEDFLFALDGSYKFITTKAGNHTIRIVQL